MIIEGYIRTTAAIWKDIQLDPGPADRWLANYFRRNRGRYGARDRRFIQETIYGAFRHKAFIQTWIDALKISDSKEAVFMMIAACIEGLLSEEEFRSVSKENIYSNLQSLQLPTALATPNEEEARFTVQHSFPSWLYQRWKTNYGKEKCEAYLKECLKRPPLTVRTNPLKITKENLLKQFQDKGYKVELTQKSIYGIRFEDHIALSTCEEFKKGFFEVQDEGSQIICEMINPQSNESVWDVCAGGGGKTLALASLMDNRGVIVATDIRKKKLENLKKRANRAGVQNLSVTDLKKINSNRFAQKGFDKILVDAPCSGTGTLRRNPDAKWRIKESDFDTYHKEQVAIIEKALPYLKIGGKLYYVTCSIDPSENEEVIGAICRKYSTIRVIPAFQYVPGLASNAEYLKLWPDEHGTDGFFLACLEKQDE